MSSRYTLKQKNGNPLKIRKGEIYCFTVSEELSIDFQEQIANVGECVHTHVWVHPSNHDASIYILDYILNSSVYHPIKLRTVAFLQAWHLEDEELDDPQEVYVEFVVDRKLSQTMANGIIDWVEEIHESVKGYQAMIGLFGEEV